MSSLHLGIIPDGNRRYASRQGRTLTEIYSQQETVIEEMFRSNVNRFPEIEEVTIFVCSRDNLLKRTPDYLESLYSFIRQRSHRCLDEATHQIRIIGHYRQYLPTDLISLLDNLQNRTRNRPGRIINLAIGYDGQQEILDAVSLLGMTSTLPITPERLRKALEIPRPIDLVIRTGGEKRTSSFCPWQTVYAEWFFEEKMWPEFTVEDVERILKEFGKRERRYGA